MGKSPLQVFNEYCIKKKAKAEFKLIKDETGSHNPTFVWRVDAFDKYATGEASTMKQAKQEAARKLLDILGVPPDGKEVDETKAMEPEKIAISQLNEYCVKKKHPKPLFQDLDEIGPDHDKIFKVQCVVSSLQEFAESKTRKRARQESALKMLKRLKTQANEDSSSINDGTEASVSSTEAPSETSSNAPNTNSGSDNGTSANAEAANATSTNAGTDGETSANGETASGKAGIAKGASSGNKSLNFDEKKVFGKLAELKKTYNPTATETYNDQCQALVGVHKKSPTLQKLINKDITNDKELAVELLAAIAEELGVDKDLKKYKNNDENKSYLYMYKLSTDPEISGVGYDENSAANHLLQTLIVMSAE